MSGGRGREKPSGRAKRDMPTLTARETSGEEVNGLTKPRTQHASRPEGADTAVTEPSTFSPPVCRPSLYFVRCPVCSRSDALVAEGKAKGGELPVRGPATPPIDVGGYRSSRAR